MHDFRYTLCLHVASLFNHVMLQNPPMPAPFEQAPQKAISGSRTGDTVSQAFGLGAARPLSAPVSAALAGQTIVHCLAARGNTSF